jgi:hypothetical protein
LQVRCVGLNRSSAASLDAARANGAGLLERLIAQIKPLGAVVADIAELPNRRDVPHGTPDADQLAKGQWTRWSS